MARWGGEEFFLALPGADAASGLTFADDLRRRCEQDLINAAGRTISCTLSGGVAAHPASGTTMDELFHAPDLALYEAKSAGRNRVWLHVDEVPFATVDVGVL
ncbi:MAG TPA: GGDEF domain-containing protein [Coriobacteriia bacterium]|nr:GGDEF domain-containing protein [Coriobacteriia bacterium]